MKATGRDNADTSGTASESIHEEGAATEDQAGPEETFDDETKHPDLPAGTYPPDPSVGDAPTAPADEGRKDAEKPR